MGNIVWLASYPKSGNTWVRMFLNNYLYSGSGRQNLNSLDLSTFGGSSKSSYRAISDQDIDACTDLEIMQLTAKAHGHIANQTSGSVFVKTHNLLAPNHGIPLITKEVTSSGIYIVRNPLDTVISVADHFGLSLDKAVDFMNNVSGSTARTETMVRQIFSSWSYNVASWTTQPPFPVWAVRYEDMHANPQKSFEDILRFLNLEIDQKKVALAVKQSSFKSLKAMEKRDGFDEKSRYSKSFFRSGKTNQWKSKLSQDQIKKLVENNYQQMKRFGYLPEGYH